MINIPPSINAVFGWFFDYYSLIGDYIYDFYYNNSRQILNYMHLSFETMFTVALYLTVAITMFYFFMAISVLFKKKHAEKALPEGKEPFVTIQIPTYNELAAINCAKRCLNFDYPKDKYEIIIGDDSSDKSVSEKIDQFASKHDIIKVTRRGLNVGYKPGNLNHMLKYTNGEYIVIFDSDFLPEKDFLKRIIAPFIHDTSISVVQARWNLKNFNQNIFSVLGSTISLICHNVALPFITWHNGNAFLCGSAECIKKKDLDDLGGWRAGSLTEDIECSLRLIKKGNKLVYLEDLRCDCEAPYNLKDLCRQQMRWGYGVISSFKLHFADMMKSKNNSKKDKFNAFIFASGYLFTFLLLLVTALGFLSFISNEPAPIDWYKFLSETARNLFITMGFLVSSIIALYINGKEHLKSAPKVVASSLSVGFVVTYYVNIGILKALFGRGMQWFMLNKNGNNRIEG